MKPQAPKCPKCGSDVRKGGQSRGRPRFKCRDQKGENCRWHGSDAIGVNDAHTAGIDRNAAKALHRKVKSARGVRRYVVTAAQNATPVHKPFLESLLTYCKTVGAQLLVIPYRYKNPTSMWSEKAQDSDWWAPELAPYLLTQRTVLGKNLVVLADIMTQPTASTPLQGFETLVGGQSAIIGHPKLELVTVPAPQNKLPKILTTTGAVTVKNYIPAKAGKKAEHHHTFGACVVEIQGDAFYMRQINAVKDGSFIDLDREYSGASARKVEHAAALVMGDTHEEFADPAVMEATFGKGGIVDVLKPTKLIWHDVHDFYSRNHHHIGEPFIDLVKHQTGTDNVEAMLDKTFAFIDGVTRPGIENIFVKSNHPDALGRWLKRADWRTDLRNAKFILRSQLAMVDAAEMTGTGARTIDPFAHWALKKLKTASQARFLGSNESYLVHDIECGYHGNDGSNGSRGSIQGFSKIGVKTCLGHVHAPGIRGGAYQGGTNARLGLEYEHGPSSHLHADIVIYANGKRSLLFIINGKSRPA